MPWKLHRLRKRYVRFWRNGYPFLLSGSPTAVERLRAWALRAELERKPLVQRWIEMGLMTFGWTIASLWNAGEVLAKQWRRSPRLALTLGRASLKAALQHNALVPALTRLRQFAGHNPAVAPHLLYDRETRVWHELNRMLGANIDDVQDKLRFFRIAKAHGLPVVPVLAAFAGGKATISPDFDILNHTDLFVKPVAGNRGANVHAWKRDDEGRWRNGSAVCETIDDLLARHSVDDCIIQPLMLDGPDLRSAGSSGLSTIRIVTVAVPGRPIKVVAALLHLCHDVISQQGTVFDIDLDNGALRSMANMEDFVLYRRDHSAAKFPLSACPHWFEIRKLAMRAHSEAFPRFSSLGWDVALVERGPMLLEANHGWGMMSHQMLGAPLGSGPLGTVAAEWLQWLREHKISHGL